MSACKVSVLFQMPPDLINIRYQIEDHMRMGKVLIFHIRWRLSMLTTLAFYRDCSAELTSGLLKWSIPDSAVFLASVMHCRDVYHRWNVLFHELLWMFLCCVMRVLGSTALCTQPVACAVVLFLKKSCFFFFFKLAITDTMHKWIVVEEHPSRGRHLHVVYNPGLRAEGDEIPMLWAMAASQTEPPTYCVSGFWLWCGDILKHNSTLTDSVSNFSVMCPYITEGKVRITWLRITCLWKKRYPYLTVIHAVIRLWNLKNSILWLLCSNWTFNNWILEILENLCLEKEWETVCHLSDTLMYGLCNL